MKNLAKATGRRLALVLLGGVCLAGCGERSVPGSPGVPEPIKVLENPQTGERARFFREIWYKTPKGIDETKHMMEWVAARQKEGFSREITPQADRTALAELRARNRAGSIGINATKGTKR